MAGLIPGARSSASTPQSPDPARRAGVAEASRTLSSSSFRRHARRTLARGFPQLTARERDVLELIAQGLDNAQIAARLRSSEKTVRNNITHIFDKLGVENRAQAIVLAREGGLGQQVPAFLGSFPAVPGPRPQAPRARLAAQDEAMRESSCRMSGRRI